MTEMRELVKMCESHARCARLDMRDWHGRRRTFRKRDTQEARYLFHILPKLNITRCVLRMLEMQQIHFRAAICHCRPWWITDWLFGTRVNEWEGAGNRKGRNGRQEGSHKKEKKKMRKASSRLLDRIYASGNWTGPNSLLLLCRL